MADRVANHIVPVGAFLDEKLVGKGTSEYCANFV
jgi:hypothetical protein